IPFHPPRASILLLLSKPVNLGARPIGSVLPVDMISVCSNCPVELHAVDIQYQVPFFVYASGRQAVFCVAQFEFVPMLPNGTTAVLRDPGSIETNRLTHWRGRTPYPVSSVRPVNLTTIGREGAGD